MATHFRSLRNIQNRIELLTWLVGLCCLLLVCCFAFLWVWEYRYQQLRKTWKSNFTSTDPTDTSLFQRPPGQ